MNGLIDHLYHLFVPHEENNFRANALSINFLTFYLLLALTLTYTFKFASTHFSDVLGFATDISVQKLLQLTNEQRAKNNLNSLKYNDELAVAAQKKATDMFSKNYWAHFGPGGESPWDFILSSGYRYSYAGENLAKNFLFSQGVVDAWMNSPSHRENLLRRDYTEVGFAVVNGVLNGEQTTLVVQMFGKPLIATTTSEPSNVVRAQEPATNKEPVQKTVAKESALVENKAASPQILARQTASPKINLFSLSLNLNVVFLVFLLVALIFDFYFATKFQVMRLGGKNIAHFIFIFFIMIAVLMFTKGAIL